MSIFSAAPATGNESIEVPRGFYPTPEAIHEVLEQATDADIDKKMEQMDLERIVAEMQSVEGREGICARLMEQQDTLVKIDPNFDPALLEEQVHMVGTTLEQMKDFEFKVAEETEKDPEKKGLLRRALGAVGGFAKKHPVVTTLLAASLVAGGVASGFYMTGNWELFMASTGLSKWFGAAEAAGEIITPTPSTPILPGGGLFEVPPPTSPPGLGTVT
ncbi:MAG: hypothetical protein K9M03_01560 [Kiritimatiellales bacterium]|nr:hypothetical protein [Kiritimatiellales bacterium]